MLNSVFFLAALTVILAIVSVMNYKTIIRKEEQAFRAYLTNSLISVDNKLKDMSRVSLMSTSGDRFQDILLNNQNRNIYEQIQDEEYLDEYYTSLVGIRDDISGIYIYDMESLIFYHDSMNPSLRRNLNAFSLMAGVKQKATNLQQANCYLAAEQLPGFMRYSQNYIENPFQGNCIWMLRDIYSFSPHKVVGSVALTIQAEKLREILEDSIGEEMFYILLTPTNKIVCCRDGNLIGMDLESISGDIAAALSTKGSMEAKWDGEICKIMSLQSEYSSLRLITGKPVRLLAKEATGFVWYSVGIGLGVAVIIIILTFRNVGRNLKPLKFLVKEMTDFDGDSGKIHYPEARSDEIRQLVKAFRGMVDMLDQLMETQYKDQMRINEIKLNEQKLSMLYLKSQVNPHFLYNTLDNIRIRAQINGDTEVCYMLMELVKFFRLNVKAGHQFVTLDHEFSLIDSYLKLMCYRYEQIGYHYNIDQTLLGVMVPNFILQPLVENSLVHGLRDKGYKGKLLIEAHRRANGGQIEISIMDDGRGFDQLDRDHICGLLDKYEDQSDLNRRTSIGIVNVQRRLKMFYGEECGLHYTENKDGGVTAHIIIKERYEIS